MRSEKLRFIIVILMLVLSGCGVKDLTKNHQGDVPVCEIHGEAMHPETIAVRGESSYVFEYVGYAREHFPNHGGHLYHGEKVDIPRCRNVVDFVCPMCDKECKRHLSEYGLFLHR